MNKKKNDNKDLLISHIVEGIHAKKGNEVVDINLEKFNNAICKDFVICHADTNIQVRAIVDSVIEQVNENLKVKPWKVQGLDNGQWVIIDFFDVVVHIFQTEYRMFYKIEDLWADAKITRFNPESEKQVI